MYLETNQYFNIISNIHLLMFQYIISHKKRHTKTTYIHFLYCNDIILSWTWEEENIMLYVKMSWCLTCLGCVLSVNGCLGEGVVQDTGGVQRMPHPPLQIVPALMWAALTCTWHIYKHSVLLRALYLFLWNRSN